MDYLSAIAEYQSSEAVAIGLLGEHGDCEENLQKLFQGHKK